MPNNTFEPAVTDIIPMEKASRDAILCKCFMEIFINFFMEKFRHSELDSESHNFFPNLD
jgi:hypothetical protein